jgi:hypothetical protein
MSLLQPDSSPWNPGRHRPKILLPQQRIPTIPLLQPLRASPNETVEKQLSNVVQQQSQEVVDISHVRNLIPVGRATHCHTHRT